MRRGYRTDTLGPSIGGGGRGWHDRRTWAAAASLITPAAPAAALDGDGKIYLVDFDSFGTSQYSDVQTYAVARNVGTAQTPLQTPRAGPGVAADRSGRVYAVGGATASADRSGNVTFTNVATVQALAVP